MSKPKKPGTDLAALKARLAKKTKGPEPAPPPPEAAPIPDVPPPGQVAAPAPMPEVPPPGQVAAPEIPPPGQPMAPPQPEVPPPGHAMPMDVPPPGQPMPAPQPEVPMPVAAPMPEPAPAPMPAPTQTSDDPFGGSAMGGFDPEAGLIDGGEIKSRSNKGIVIFAALLAAGIGGAVGWTGHTIIGKRDKIAQGKAKGEKMVTAVQKISDARKSVSLAMEDLKKDIAKDPTGSADTITTLLTESFDKQPQVSELFGWQLASVDPGGLKASFQLYERLTTLQENLGMMAKVLKSYGQFIKVGGPSLYGVTFSVSGAQMVGIADSLCGALPPEGEPSPEALKALKPCGPDVAKAVAYVVLNPAGGDPTVMLRGLGEKRVQLLLAEGKVYDYAIGIEQKNNATQFYKMALIRAEESLAEMNQAEERAMKALKRYADDPNVDGPAPSGGGEG
ncbi:MAG: hypothetical protein AAGF11_24080 [Myxococcota bacterium]